MVQSDVAGLSVQTIANKTRLASSYISAIKNDYAIAKRIFDKTGDEDFEILQMINNSTIIAMCIKYETFASELFAAITNRKISYNRPWFFTRVIAQKLRINISEPYQKAHDAWEYYNALKHVNSHSVLTSLNFAKQYKIDNSWAALRFVYDSLINLLTKFL